MSFARPSAKPAWGTAVLACAHIASAACARTARPASPAPAASPSVGARADSAPYASTYRRRAAAPILIRDARVLTAAGPELERASVLIRDGRIVAVGTDVDAPAEVEVVDGSGRWVTPGIIDAHSHLGVYPAPGTPSEADGNEATNPVTAEVWAEHSVWPQDPQIPLAIAGGVTVIQTLPGSANLIGGRTATLRLVPARTVQEMKFPGAPHGVKMACGENPKRNYAARGPSTRMGNMAGLRAALFRAERYRREWDNWEQNGGNPPSRDLQSETLADVLRGKILVHNHCYRADEMAQMLDLAREFKFRIRGFHHAVEAYKVADLLAKDSVAAMVWADWWGFKMESLDGIPHNAALLFQAGVRPVIHSDDPSGGQRLNQEAAKAMYAARQIGIEVTRADAIRWITANAAWAIGIDDVTGTIEPGKLADVVVWSGDPFSIYSRPDLVISEGSTIFDRRRGPIPTDFNLGVAAPGVAR